MRNKTAESLPECTCDGGFQKCSDLPNLRKPDIITQDDILIYNITGSDLSTSEYILDTYPAFLSKRWVDYPCWKFVSKCHVSTLCNCCRHVWLSYTFFVSMYSPRYFYPFILCEIYENTHIELCVRFDFCFVSSSKVKKNNYSNWTAQKDVGFLFRIIVVKWKKIIILIWQCRRTWDIFVL